MKIKKMLYVLTSALMLLLVACSSGQTIEINVKIIKVYESDKWGCISDSSTIVKTFDNRVDVICGYYGQVGDTIRGYWTTGHWDNSQNGFHLNN